MFGSLNKTSPCTNSPPHQKLELRFWGREDHDFTGKEMISLVLYSKHGSPKHGSLGTKNYSCSRANYRQLKAADKKNNKNGKD